MDGPARARLQARRRSAGARGGDDLSADAARLPAGAARSSSTCSNATPRSCRASCRSATSTRTSSRSPKPRSARPRRGARPAGGARRAGAHGCCSRELILKWAATPEMRGGEQRAAGRQQPGRGAGARRRSRAPDGRHDDAAGAVGPARRPGAGRARRILAERRCDFLKIAREYWPAILEGTRPHRAGRAPRPADRGRSASGLQTSAGPVIAAGSTGSIPATATLLATIAKLPHGALVLPGLDTDLDEATWNMIAAATATREAAHGHPQFAMPALLQTHRHRPRRGRSRWRRPRRTAASGSPRRRCGRRRPASFGRSAWRMPASPRMPTPRLHSVAVIEAANAEEEALAIAVALREAVDDPGKTAALVTPDRALARRVLAALARWNVPVDDSGGDALPDTPAGVFARLAAEAALDGLAPVTLLALLKHPLVPASTRAAVATLERAVLRGPRPKRRHAPGWHTRCRPSARACETPPQGAVDAASLRSAHVDRPMPSSTPPPIWSPSSRRRWRRWNRLPPGPQPFRAIAARHRRRRWPALGGITEELAKAFDEIAERRRARRSSRATMPSCSTPRSPTARCAGPRPTCGCASTARSKRGCSRSTALVLGGLVEGVWPPETRGDPWLSRPMRHELGLDLPERRIGLSAHDFAQALGAPEVILTRAAKLGGAPTVASRFVQRLAAVAGEARWNAALERGARYVGAGAQARRAPATADARCTRPEPRPPLAARPTSAQRHRDRALAARSLHDLRQAHPQAAAARRHRHAARRAPTAAP